MEEHELKDIWAKSSGVTHIKFNASQLINELTKTMDRIDRKIKSRDTREIGVSIFGILLFGYMAYEIPFPLTKFACVLTQLWFMYVIYRLRATRRNEKPDLSLPFKEQLNQRKAYLMQQEYLLRSVLYWYILPPFICNVLFFAGIGDTTPYDSFILNQLPESTSSKIGILIFTSIFYAYIVWMNRRAAKENFLPVIKDIEKLQGQLSRE